MKSNLPVDCAAVGKNDWWQIYASPTRCSSRTIAHPWKRLQQRRRSKPADRSAWPLAPPWSIVVVRRRQRRLHDRGVRWRRPNERMHFSDVVAAAAAWSHVCERARCRGDVMQLADWTDCRPSTSGCRWPPDPPAALRYIDAIPCK